MYYHLQTIGIIAAVIGIVVATMVGVVMLANWSSDVSCHARWADEFKPAYSFWSGCLIEADGQRIPAANYRVL